MTPSLVPLRLLYSLAICAAGQLPFPVLGLDQSAAPSTHHSERPKRASDERRLATVRCSGVFGDVTVQTRSTTLCIRLLYPRDDIIKAFLRQGMPSAVLFMF